ncbi:hypothetical protein OROMI_018798 [Orobanche minor]
MAEINELAENNEFTLPELEGRPRRRKQTKKKGLQKEEFANHNVIEFNSYGVPVGKGRNDLRTYIGVIVRETISILHDDWRHVPMEIKDSLWLHFQKKFKLSVKSKNQVFKWMGVALRNFRSELANDFILPWKDDLTSLTLPPIEYPSIKKTDWKFFVDKVLSEEFQDKSKKARGKRAKNVYNHRLGSTGYGGMLYRKKKEAGVSEREIDRSDAWLMARADNKGEYAPEIMPVVDKISELKSQTGEGTFQSAGFQFMSNQLEIMNASLNAYNNTEIGSSSFPNPKSTCGNQFETNKQSPETLGKRKDISSLRKVTPEKVQSKIKKTCEKTPHKLDFEVTSKLTPKKNKLTPKKNPIVLEESSKPLSKPISPNSPVNDVQFLYNKRVQKNEPLVIKPLDRKLERNKNIRGAAQSKESGKSEYMNMFTMFVENSLPRSILIGYLCEDIYNSRIASPFQFGLFEKLHPTKFGFNDRSQYISKLLGLTELGQVVVVPYNPGGHWVLFAIDLVSRVVYYLDPMRHSPNENMKQIVNQGIRIYQSLKCDRKINVQWVCVKCPKQPSFFECGYYVMKYIEDIVKDVNILKNNFKGIDNYSMKDLSELCDRWATYVAKLITAYNRELEKLEVAEHGDSEG